MHLISSLLICLSMTFAPIKAPVANPCNATQRPTCCATECCALATTPAKPAPTAKDCCALPCCPEWLCKLLGCSQ